MRRGEKEGFLGFRIIPPEDKALMQLEALFVKGAGLATQQVKMAVHDSYKRLLSLSIETEIRLATKERAEEEAIRVFAENLRQLLLAPPLDRKISLPLTPVSAQGVRWFA